MTNKSIEGHWDLSKLCNERTGMSQSEFKKQYHCEFTPEKMLISTSTFHKMQNRIDELEAEKYQSIESWNSQLEKASARIAELEKRNSELSEYKFKHPKSGEAKTVMINRQFILDRLIDEIYDQIDCDCEPSPIGCDCDEYFAEFDFIELNKESK